MMEDKTPHIEQKIVAGPGATIKDVQQIVYLRPKPGIPFQAPAVPRYFVPRPEVSKAILDYLNIEVSPGVLVASVVHGLGGIGKTTLVAALAHNTDVQSCFPDGVLWATLGQQPDVLSLLAGWIQALGDYDFRPITAEMAFAHLCTLLHDKACLLVVDDAWQANHLRSFLVGGDRCRMLVTTRDASLARKLGAQLYYLDVMTEAQALALIESRLGPLEDYREQATALARELGYLPLALELATAQVESGVYWTELLEALRQGFANLAVLDFDEVSFRNESLRLSFQLSLERLSPDDLDAFVCLGVLAEDAQLNPFMATILWGLPDAEARTRLRLLRDRALLKHIGNDRYTLHDLLHDEAKLRLVEQMQLEEAHALLLECYRARTRGLLWHTLPDDGYIHAHLTWHMEKAGQINAIYALLGEETSEEQNGWYEIRERLGQTAGYLDDIRCAWRLADVTDHPISSMDMKKSVGLQTQYALITTTMSSLASNIPPMLVVALVEQEIWLPAQGLTYARQTLNIEKRAETLAKLVPMLSNVERERVVQEALAAVREIKDRAAYRGRWDFEQENVVTEALTALAPYLSEPLLQESLGTARKLNKDFRTRALASLASHLPAPLRNSVIREELVAMQNVKSNTEYVRALAALAPHLPAELKEEAALKALAAGSGSWAFYYPQIFIKFTCLMVFYVFLGRVMINFSIFLSTD